MFRGRHLIAGSPRPPIGPDPATGGSLVLGLLYTANGPEWTARIPAVPAVVRLPATSEHDPCIESSARKSWRLTSSVSGSRARTSPASANRASSSSSATGEDGERIPLTIADVDRTRGAISIIVQGVGKSTRQLNALNEGDTILDVAGPLGRATEIHPGRKVCCIGGGIGTAVVYPIACGVKALQGEVVAIIGGRTKDLVILETGTARGGRPGHRHHRRRVVRRAGAW